MCLPGTVETVREGIENEREETGRGGVSRRAALAGGGAAAALAALGPAPALAWRGRHRGGKRRYEDLTHVFTAGFPVYAGDPPTRRTLTTVEAGRLLQAGMDLRRALGHAHGRAGALHRRWAPSDRAAPA